MSWFLSLWARFVTFLFNRGATDRAAFFVDKFKENLAPSSSILDLGCGTGHLGIILSEDGHQVSLIDVPPPLGYLGQSLFGIPIARYLCEKKGLDYRHYSGKHLPYSDGSFDVVLVAFVLHHAQDAEALLREAARVARKRVIVIEDIPHSRWQAFVGWLSDKAINLEFSLGRHGNLSEESWLQMFARNNLRVIHKDSWVGKLFILRFPNTLFVLNKVS